MYKEPRIRAPSRDSYIYPDRDGALKSLKVQVVEPETSLLCSFGPALLWKQRISLSSSGSLVPCVNRYSSTLAPTVSSLSPVMERAKRPMQNTVSFGFPSQACKNWFCIVKHRSMRLALRALALALAFDACRYMGILLEY